MASSVLFVILLVCVCISFCSASCSYSSCSSCVDFSRNDPAGVSCHWCPSWGCYNWFDSPNSCNNDIALPSMCPASTSGSITSGNNNNGNSGDNDGNGGNGSTGTGLVFMAFFIVSIVLVIVLFSCRRCSVSPIVEMHKNRINFMDFGAFPDSLNIQNTITQSAGPGLLWADVHINVPKISELVGLIVWYVIGTVISLFVLAFSWVFIPVLLAMYIPVILYIIASLKQLIGKQHYTNIYWLNNNGATILRKGRLCGGSSTANFDYCDMKDIHSRSSTHGLGCVYFAKQWKLQRQIANQPRGNPRTTRFSHYDNQGNRYVYKKVSIGFENVVRHLEVENIIHQQLDRCCAPAVQVTNVIMGGGGGVIMGGGGGGVAVVSGATTVVAAPQPIIMQQPVQYVQQQQQPIVMQQPVQYVQQQQQPVQYVQQQQPVQQQQQQQPAQYVQQPVQQFQQQPMQQQQQFQQQPMQQQFQQQPMQQQPMQQQPMQQQPMQQQPMQQQFQQQPMQQQPMQQQQFQQQQTPTPFSDTPID